MYIKINIIIDPFSCPSDLIHFSPQNNIVKAVVNEQSLKAVPHITTLLVSSQCTVCTPDYRLGTSGVVRGNIYILMI